MDLHDTGRISMTEGRTIWHSISALLGKTFPPFSYSPIDEIFDSYRPGYHICPSYLISGQNEIHVPSGIATTNTSFELSRTKITTQGKRLRPKTPSLLVTPNFQRLWCRDLNPTLQPEQRHLKPLTNTPGPDRLNRIFDLASIQLPLGQLLQILI